MNFRTLLLAAALMGAPAAYAETRAVIDTNMGSIELSLDETKAPQTVANFVQYAEKGFYNHTVFHRVIDGFMIQGGGLTSDLLEKPTQKAIVNEADNGLKNTAGTIAMARTAAPNSATSQFFINLADNDFLNFKNKTTAGWGYAVFGKVVEGQDVVDQIENVATKRHGYHDDVPVEPVVITKAEIV